MYMVRLQKLSPRPRQRFSRLKPLSFGLFIFLAQGNLDERVSDALIWELMLQAGPVCEFGRVDRSTTLRFLLTPALLDLFPARSANVHLPKDRISMSHQGYGFCEFLTEDDADYACKIMNQIKLFGKPIRVNKVSRCVLVGLIRLRFRWLMANFGDIGIFRQKAIGYWSQPLHRKSGSQC